MEGGSWDGGDVHSRLEESAKDMLVAAVYYESFIAVARYVPGDVDGCRGVGGS